MQGVLVILAELLFVLGNKKGHIFLHHQPVVLVALMASTIVT